MTATLVGVVTMVLLVVPLHCVHHQYQLSAQIVRDLKEIQETVGKRTAIHVGATMMVNTSAHINCAPLLLLLFLAEGLQLRHHIVLTVKETRSSLETHGRRIVILADVEKMEDQPAHRDSALIFNKKIKIQKVEHFVKSLHSYIYFVTITIKTNILLLIT